MADPDGTASNPAAPDGPALLLRSDIHTHDYDVAIAAFTQLGAHRPRISLTGAGRGDFRIRSTRYGAFRADLIRSDGICYQAEADPLEQLLGGVLVHGTGTHRTASRTYSVTPGDAFLHPLDVSFDLEHRDTQAALVALPLHRAALAAEQATGTPAERLRFHDMSPVSPAMNHYWASTLSFVHRQLATPELELPPLLVEHLIELVASAAVAVFPNTAMTAARSPAEGYTGPATVRRAVDFIEAHADRPMTVAEVAAAAGIGPRAVQVAFRRAFGTTPLEYARRVRLARAHQDLSAADPSRGVTVTQVARRWGFNNVGRFAGLYRAEYGRSPNTTLHT